MSLRRMAIQKQLPLHQYMDSETLAWTREYAQEEGVVLSESILLPKDADQFDVLRPSPSFFVNKEIYNGLHGFKHCARVGFLAGLIANERGNGSMSILKIVTIAGSLHDCRRMNDNADEGHGARSADWLGSNVDAVSEHFSVSLSEEERRLVDMAIRFHDTRPMHEITQEEHEVIEIIKTADALDRYRQPKEKWWINEEYLEIKPSQLLKNVAYNLMYFVENAYLQEKDNEKALTAALEKVQYV